jgi:hypothetical protein
MSDPQSSQGNPAAADRGGEELSTLFAHLVVQQANMALMLLGKVAHPESGQVMRDLEAAKLFIDQLAMLEVKTRGNLTREEGALLKQSLMNLRLAFVEAVEAPPAGAPAQTAAQTPPPSPQAAPGPAAPPSPGAQTPPPAAAEESRKKFTKKY